VTGDVTEARQEPWHVTVTPGYPYPPPSPPERLWRLREDLSTAALMVVLLALVAPVIGLLWAHMSPKLSITALVGGSETPFKSQIGDDAWFLLLTALAGATTGWFVTAVGGRGPGAVLGLVLGGGVASAVAARVGFLAERGHTLAQLRARGITPRADLLDIVDFKLRALGVATAWSFAALLVFVIIVAIRNDTSSLP
jgi:hypothetical protein